jgi:hypothetical protein
VESTPIFLLNLNYYGPANIQRVTNELAMKILTTPSQPNGEYRIPPNSPSSPEEEVADPNCQLSEGGSQSVHRLFSEDIGWVVVETL